MMLAIEQTAQQWVSEELQSLADRNPFKTDAEGTKLQASPAKWVLPKLLRIVYANTDQPVESLAPLIREMLQEQAFANTGGDPCNCEHLQESINETVGVLVRVLERVRQHCIAATAG